MELVPQSPVQGLRTEHKDFASKISVVSCFLEHDGKVLLLKYAGKHDQSGNWGVPGGKVETTDPTLVDALTREIFEELKFDIKGKNPEYHGPRFIRVPKCPDYTLHIYRLPLKDKPKIVLSDEHTDSVWTPVEKFKEYSLLKAQGHVFDELYHNTVWRRIFSESLSSLKLKQGDDCIEFSSARRLFITLIGTTGTGKGTQGSFLSANLGMPLISIGDMFRDEIRGKTSIGEMITSHDKKHLEKFNPDEIPLGMMAKRMADDDAINGCILDGFPRTPGQADVLLKVFLRPNDVHIPIFIDVPENVIRKRLEERFICNSCGWQKRAFDRLAEEGVCPKDQGKLVKRVADGNSEKLNKKFEIFNEHKDAILEALMPDKKESMLILDGSEPPGDVWTRIGAIINRELRKVASKL